MGSIPFINKTGKTKFEGTFILDSIEYKYTFYLPPIITELPKNESEEIISYFGNRMWKNKICLGVDEDTVRFYLDHGQVSVFAIVQPEGINNIASGTLQYYNHCYLNSNTEEQNLSLSDVWINDICRVSESKNEGNPLKGLLFLLEQLAVQNVGKHNIKLTVEKEETNLNVLKSKYESYGFTLNNSVNKEICPEWKYPTEMVMEKQNLAPNTDIIDLSFLKIPRYNLRSSKKQRVYGGKKKKTPHKSIKNRRYKKFYTRKIQKRHNRNK
jgi:hypothetical protein